MYTSIKSNKDKRPIRSNKGRSTDSYCSSSTYHDYHKENGIPLPLSDKELIDSVTKSLGKNPYHPKLCEPHNVTEHCEDAFPWYDPESIYNDED